MAGIDKIYASYKDAVEFLNWIEDNDKSFQDEFKNASIKDFMYITSFQEYQGEHPISNFPTLVDKWLFRQPTIPEYIYNYIKWQYNLNTEEKINDFINSPLEIEDTRKKGSHLKIISREGCLEHSNWFIHPCIEIDNWYYIRKWRNKHHNILYQEECIPSIYEQELISDYYWYREDTDDWENIKYKKIKNILSNSSSCQHIKKYSLKSVIKHLLRKYKFPIGTIIKIEELKYVGTIYLKVIN